MWGFFIPNGSEEVEFRGNFVPPFAPCFADGFYGYSGNWLDQAPQRTSFNVRLTSRISLPC